MTICTILALLSAWPSTTLGPPLSASVRFVQEVRCDSQSGFGSLVDLEVRVAVPPDLPRQRIDSLTFTPAPAAIIETAEGDHVAVFQRPALAAGERWEVGWTCQVALHAVEHQVRTPLGPWEEDAKLLGPEYLEAGTMFSSNDPDMIRRATVLRAGAQNPLDLAFRINEDLRDSLRYVNDGRWDSAAASLANGHASCSEYTFAFVGLARLAGLPARYVGATALRSDDGVYEDTIHHRWAEAFIPGHGWFPVDVSRNDGEEGGPSNQWFGRTSGRLLVLTRGSTGDGHPLGWGYVSAADAQGEGDGELRSDKRFLWTPGPLVTAQGAPPAHRSGEPEAGLIP